MDLSYSIRQLDFTLDNLPEIHLIFEDFETLETHGCISHAVFDSWLIRKLSARSRSLSCFHQVFKNLDDAGSFSVATHDLVCALMPFCPGSKSDKLAMAFTIFSSDDDDDDDDNGDDDGANGEDLLSIRALWQILRAFVAGLSAIAKFSVSNQEVAVVTLSKITGFYKKQKHINMEDLSNWYSFCGEEISCWFELLDRRKWCGVEAISSSTTFNTKNSNSSAISSAGEGERARFTSPSKLSAVTNPSQHELTICSRVMVKIAKSNNTYSQDFDSVWLDPFTNFGNFQLSEVDCQAYLKRVLKADEGYCTRFTRFLFQNNTEHKTYASVALVASMLFEGHKTSKLKKYFEHLNLNSDRSDGNLIIRRVDLYDMLSTIYLSIHFLSARPYLNSAVDRQTLINVTNVVASDEGVSFSDFGDWYNEEGFYIMSWLELLNPMKLASKSS